MAEKKTTGISGDEGVPLLYLLRGFTDRASLYFQGFKRLIEENPIYREMVLIEIKPCGAETLRVIHQAERYVKENQISKGQIHMSNHIFKENGTVNLLIKRIFAV